MSETVTKLPKNFSMVIKDIVEGLPAKSLTIVRGNSTNICFKELRDLIATLHEHNIQVINLDIMSDESKENYYRFLKEALDISEERTSLILCEVSECETIITELSVNNIIHRSILYIFYWPRGDASDKFLSVVSEAMKIAVITNPRRGVFRVYYNQATPNRLQELSLVNWWSGRLYKSPVLPPPSKIYHNFRDRVFNVPVLHAPPWHFVEYKNNTNINVTGGRDDKLLKLLANKLNFRYKYYDPPDRSQGSGISSNGTFKGTLGLLWKRRAPFFIGDVTMTWKRLQAVEFSFFTLADSGAFLTHAPAKLSETLSIIRPFRSEVWPFVFATLIVSGPALWIVAVLPTWWKSRNQRHLTSFGNCCWFATTLFLRQSSSKEPCNTHKARLVSVLISLGATYVIADMYSANLTSLLARPAREQPIGTLQALEEAMRDNNYELLVERHSSSLTILENGTGVYGRLARLMRRQRVQRVRSVEMGVRMVLTRRRLAILGGRETLYYDTERFGPHNFHLSEKLYTRYSAIAFQIGSPYLETFNKVIMTLFEAGILSKITTDEYRNLPERSGRLGQMMKNDPQSSYDKGMATGNYQAQFESTKGLEPVTLGMLRGAFCLLGVGYLLSALTLIIEVQLNCRRRTHVIVMKNTAIKKQIFRLKFVNGMRKSIRRGFRGIVQALYRYIDAALGPVT